MSRVLEAPVTANVELSPGNWKLTLSAPEIAGECAPGQFVMAAPADDRSLPWPLLRRALAVYAVGDRGGTPGSLDFLVKTVGDGTRRLARLRPGDGVGLIGPLGRGFEIHEDDRIDFILAGGIGIASVYLLAERLAAARRQVHLVYGGRTAADLVGADDFRRLGVAVHPVTEDGGAGIRGLITDGLVQILEDFDHRRLRFYTCGPNPMMRAVARIAEQLGVPCQISVETRMGCGFGVCLGCTVQTLHGYRLACRQGPVFDAGEFVWEEDAALL